MYVCSMFNFTYQMYNIPLSSLTLSATTSINYT